MTKRQKEMLNYLGKEYRMKIIDLENCICRDLGDYDIEISLTGSRKSYVNIYVWRTKGGYEIIEKYFKVDRNLVNVKVLLDDIVSRYEAKALLIKKIEIKNEFLQK